MVALDQRYVGSMGVNRSQLGIISFYRSILFLEQKLQTQKQVGYDGDKGGRLGGRELYHEVQLSTMHFIAALFHSQTKPGTSVPFIIICFYFITLVFSL